MSDQISSPPFDVFIHLNSKYPENSEAILELRNALHSSSVFKTIINHYPEAADWCTDMQLARFLIARCFKVAPALKLLLSALEWRSRRKPELVERQPGFEDTFGKQGSTGKVYCPGMDRCVSGIADFKYSDCHCLGAVPMRLIAKTNRKSWGGFLPPRTHSLSQLRFLFPHPCRSLSPPSALPVTRPWAPKCVRAAYAGAACARTGAAAHLRGRAGVCFHLRSLQGPAGGC